MKQKLYKPNCFEKTEVRWGIFSFFSYTNVETKNFTPIAYNTEIDAIKKIYAIKVLRIYKIKTFLILK